MELLFILKRCRAWCRTSQDAPWSSLGVAEIIAILDRAITSLEREEDPDRDELRLLFAPTGPLQDTSIHNGWSDEYLQFAAAFDSLMR